MKRTNPYVYENRIVAFVDVLGFKSLVDDSCSDTLIRKKIKKALKIIDNLKFQKNKENCIDDVLVTTFSDSAVISYPSDSLDSLFYVLLDIIHLQIQLTAMGILIRGGISIGNVYHDGNIVFGPAMNDAYLLENSIAEYPRVIIENNNLYEYIEKNTNKNEYGYLHDIKDIIDLLRKCDDNFSKVEDITRINYDHPMINEGRKEYYFIDFLRQPQELTDDGDEYYSWLKDIRVFMIEFLNRYSPSNEERNSGMSDADAERIFKKYRWLLYYWNDVLLDNNANYPVPKIDIEGQKKFRMKYNKLGIKKKYPYY